MALLRQMDGQGRPPASGAEDRNRSHYALAPRRRSVPVRRRPTLERCRNTISTQAAHATTTTGSGLPVAYAMGGSASDASTDPSDTYLVIQTVPPKTASTGATAAGVKTAKTPHAVATPLPPRKCSQNG